MTQDQQIEQLTKLLEPMIVVLDAKAVAVYLVNVIGVRMPVRDKIIDGTQTHYIKGSDENQEAPQRLEFEEELKHRASCQVCSACMGKGCYICHPDYVAKKFEFGDDHLWSQIVNNYCLHPPTLLKEDISIHGVHITKDGKRVDPKDFYKPSPTLIALDLGKLSDVIEDYKLNEELDAVSENRPPKNLAWVIYSKFGQSPCRMPSETELEDIIERVIKHCETMPKEYEAIQWFPKQTLAQAILHFLKERHENRA